MGPLPKSAANARAERRAMIALAAVFALFLQALAPTFASAAPLGPGAVICAPAGAAAGSPGGDPAHAPPGHSCQHCVCPALAATPPPVIEAAVVVYAAVAVVTTPALRSPPPQARAPPRPPGQGPPTLHA